MNCWKGQCIQNECEEDLGTEIPDDAKAQLEGGIKAVFKAERKKSFYYRRIEVFLMSGVLP
jgi:hypothetical protein